MDVTIKKEVSADFYSGISVAEMEEMIEAARSIGATDQTKISIEIHRAVDQRDRDYYTVRINAAVDKR